MSVIVACRSVFDGLDSDSNMNMSCAGDWVGFVTCTVRREPTRTTGSESLEHNTRRGIRKNPLKDLRSEAPDTTDFASGVHSKPCSIAKFVTLV